MNPKTLIALVFSVLALCPAALSCDQCGRPTACGCPAPQPKGCQCCPTKMRPSLLQCLCGNKKPCGHQNDSCGSQGCDVHVHYVGSCGCDSKKDNSEPASEAPAETAAQSLMYQPVVQAQAAMPMMMPMMMPFPMPMMGMYPQQMVNQRQNNNGNNSDSSGGCSECMPRVERLENGVQVLAERMDKIESILESQSLAMVAIKDAIKAQEE